MTGRSSSWTRDLQTNVFRRMHLTNDLPWIFARALLCIYSNAGCILSSEDFHSPDVLKKMERHRERLNKVQQQNTNQDSITFFPFSRLTSFTVLFFQSMQFVMNLLQFSWRWEWWPLPSSFFILLYHVSSSSSIDQESLLWESLRCSSKRLFVILVKVWKGQRLANRSTTRSDAK